jgi:hypothetical protein
MAGDLDRIAQRWIDGELRGGARWFGFAVAVAPVFDRLDDAGIFNALATGQLDALTASAGGMAALLWCGLFVTLGIAAAAILRRHRSAVRPWFFAACAVPVLGYAAYGGFRVSTWVSVLAFAVAALRLRAARGHDTLGIDTPHASARYAEAGGDVPSPP